MIWILRPVAEDHRTSGDDPWDPWYDKSFGFVVIAQNEEEARNLAHESGGDENRDVSPWLDAKYSNCDVLEDGPESRVVIKDFHYA